MIDGHPNYKSCNIGHELHCTGAKHYTCRLHATHDRVEVVSWSAAVKACLCGGGTRRTAAEIRPHRFSRPVRCYTYRLRPSKTAAG